MKRAAAMIVLLVACKHDVSKDDLDAALAVPPPTESETTAPSATAVTPMPSASTPASAAASASSAPQHAAPKTAAEIPAAWLACARSADCVALDSACCGAWPSNVASLARVRAAMAASDAARGNCTGRVCAMRKADAVCESGRCVVR